MAFLTTWIGDARSAIGFFTRWPVTGHGDPRALRLGALAALTVSLPSAAILIGAMALGAGPMTAAVLALCVAVAGTGALHEDGLADLADASGGRTRERRLEIMKDSRIGAYGVCALALSLLLRVALISELAARSPALAALGLVLAMSASRAAALWPLWRLPPARSDGLGQWNARRPTREIAEAGLWAVAIAILIAALGLGFMPALLGLVGAVVGAAAVTAFARRLIGGQTGDVAGAAQQIAEICALLLVALALGAAAPILPA